MGYIPATVFNQVDTQSREMLELRHGCSTVTTTDHQVHGVVDGDAEGTMQVAQRTRIGVRTVVVCDVYAVIKQSRIRVFKLCQSAGKEEFPHTGKSKHHIVKDGATTFNCVEQFTKFLAPVVRLDQLALQDFNAMGIQVKRLDRVTKLHEHFLCSHPPRDPVFEFDGNGLSEDRNGSNRLAIPIQQQANLRQSSDTAAVLFCKVSPAQGGPQHGRH